jgi:ornithine cyclodeaminase/alanine dehydrogenase-like protein (mu-crystallin family)
VTLLVLSASDVRAALSYADCVDAMREALLALATGRAQMPLRTVIRPAGAAGLMALMPSYLSGAAGDASAGGDSSAAGNSSAAGATYGLKAICITPSNPAAGLDTHLGVVLLSSGETGEPVALLNASAITEIRTAAVSVIATDLLARPDATELAVIGAGVQARAHILALDGARALTAIRVAGRHPARTAEFAASLAGQTRAPVHARDSVRDAVDGASIVVTATSSAEPVVERDWLAPGTHINAVGACLPGMRELDTATMAAAALFADRRDSMLTESGDYLLAAAEGAVGPDQIRAELGELLAHTASGRRSANEITVFESLGLAVEDLGAASRACAVAARTRGTPAQIGSWLDF